MTINEKQHRERLARKARVDAVLTEEIQDLLKAGGTTRYMWIDGGNGRIYEAELIICKEVDPSTNLSTSYNKPVGDYYPPNSTIN